MLIEVPVPEAASGGRIRGWILRGSAGGTPQVWGLSPEDRLRRTLRRVVVPANPAWSRPGDSARGESALVLRADYVVDERVVEALLARPGSVLLDLHPAGGDAPLAVAAHVGAEQREQAAELLARVAVEPSRAPLAGARWAAAADLVPSYDSALRKSQPPILARVTRENVTEIERSLFDASYKGVTDLVTKWLWPRPARAVTGILARRHVAPNAVTALSWVLVIAAAACFAKGAFSVGLVAAWAMTFLDTVDGKLARVTLTSSRVGHVLDHGLDIIHPPFWYLGWGMGLVGGIAAHPIATWVTVGGYVVGRLLELAFMLAFKIETHSWKPIDSWFRTITARRNPNLILLTIGAALGRADLGLALVAGWTLISLAFHACRLAQAAACRRRGIPVGPWYVPPSNSDPTAEISEDSRRSFA